MELKEQLEALSTKLEGKAKEEVKTAIEAFMTENTKAITEATTEVKDALLEEIKTLKENAEKMQEHADALDVKLQAKNKGENKGKGFTEKMAEFVKANGEKIKGVRGKISFSPDEVKAVGNMTTANLTGDEEREYSRNVIGVAGRAVHFTDLTGRDINIGVGTYTFPRESGAEGAIATQTEGSDKAQVDYDFTNVDVATDFLAGFAVYSKKMRNNLPFLEGFLPSALRRDYMNAEDGVFNTVLAAAATASTQIITSNTKIGMIYGELATLAAANIVPNAVVMTPADYYDILQFEKSTGAGYGLPMGATVDANGQVRLLGIPVVWVNWLAANKYYVGDFSEVNKVVTEGLSLEFSEHDEDNFRKNNITARIESQVGLAVHRPAAIIYGDFTAT